MLSRTTRYALLTLGHLLQNPGRLVTGDEIAAATGVPASYLVKILGQLRKQGFVESRKGWGGGFMIRGDALERPIRDVLMVFDGPAGFDGDACVFGQRRCDCENPCSLHPFWERIRATFDEMLSATSIANLTT